MLTKIHRCLHQVVESGAQQVPVQSLRLLHGHSVTAAASRPWKIRLRVVRSSSVCDYG